jgi:hypothetical protein
MRFQSVCDRGYTAALAAAAAAMALAACGGQGPANATEGAQQAVAAHGRDRGHRHGREDEPSLRARAARGLAISPVPVDTAGLSAHQRRLVGLGSYIVNAASDCAACHTGPAGFLSGGNPFFLDAAGHVVWTRNLTPDPDTGLKLTWEQFEEAIRTGRDFHEGATTIMVVMPWTTLRWASELDLRAIYAYLRAIPPVNNPVPPDDKSGLPLPAAVPFPGHVYTDGLVVRRLPGNHRSFDPRRGLAISPLDQPAHLHRGRLEGYGVGSYVANALAHCNDCHTHPDRTADSARVNTDAFLTGGTVFAVPPPLQPVFKQLRTMSANLKGATHGFFSEPDDSLERFRDIIVSGTHADETPPRPLGFPMNLVAGNLKNLLDDDLEDVYEYVKRSPATTGAADAPRQPYARWCGSASDCATGETCAASSECVGGACTSDLDCGACQTCGGGTCKAPATDSACVASAQ